MTNYDQQLHPLLRYFDNVKHLKDWDENLPIQRAIDAMRHHSSQYSSGVFDSHPLRKFERALLYENYEQMQEAIWLFRHVRSLESYLKVGVDEVIDSNTMIQSDSKYSVEGLFGYPMDVFRGVRFDFNVDSESNQITSLWAAIDGIIPQPTNHESFEPVDLADPRRKSHPALDALFDFLASVRNAQDSADYQCNLHGDANAIDILYHAVGIQQPQKIYIERPTHLISSDGEEHPFDIDEHQTYLNSYWAVPSSKCVNIIFERPMKWHESNSGVLRTIFTLIYEVHFRADDDNGNWIVQKIRSSVPIIGGGVKPWLRNSIYHEIEAHLPKAEETKVESSASSDAFETLCEEIDAIMGEVNTSRDEPSPAL